MSEAVQPHDGARIVQAFPADGWRAVYLNENAGASWCSPPRWSLGRSSAAWTRTRGACRPAASSPSGPPRSTQLILAWRQGRGPAIDSPHLNGLRRDARRYGRSRGRERRWLLVADAGFDGRGVRDGDLIPPVRRHRKLVAPTRRARADLVAAARLGGGYGQRWKGEAVHSVIQRKTGDAIRSRLPRNQRLEPALKGLDYNLHRSALLPNTARSGAC